MKRFPLFALLVFPWGLSAQTFNWTAQDTYTFDTYAGELNPDKDGGVYVLGKFGDEPSHIAPPPGSQGYFVNRYDARGTLLWRQALPEVFELHASSTENGELLVTGIDTANQFVIRFDKSGNQVWKKNLFPKKNANATGIKSGPDGYFYLAGIFRSTLILGTNIFSNLNGSNAAFVAKFDAGGVCIWAKASDEGTGPVLLNTDPKGYVYIFSSYFSHFYLEHLDLSSTGRPFIDYYLAKFTPTGQLITFRRLPISMSGVNIGVAGFSSFDVDDKGNLYFSGEYMDADLLVQYTTLPYSGKGRAGFVCKLTPGLDVIWAKNLSDEIDVGVSKVLCGNNGDCYVTGNFFKNLELGKIQLHANNNLYEGRFPFYYDGLRENFVAGLDEAGNVSWATIAGCDSGFARGTNLLITDDVLYLTGSHIGHATFQQAPLQSEKPSMFIAAMGEFRVETGIADRVDGAKEPDFFPNPVNNVIEVRNLVMDNSATMYISDLMGRQFVQQQITSNKIVLDRHLIQAGVYLLTVEAGDKVIQQKIIVH